MKVHLRMLGCRLNQSEIDHMARQFGQLGHEVVDEAATADWLVVNTCAVTQEATRKSRQLVRELRRSNPTGQITVTGCYAQIAPDEIAVLPGVERVIDNEEKDNLVATVSGQSPEPFDLEPFDRAAKVGMLGRARAFVKVQDGCDNACTFCITTVARGAGRSRPVEEIVREIQFLHAVGYQEVVLTGVHLGSYGHDWGQRDGLAQLVRGLLDDTDVPRIRLSSLEPWDLSESFFDLWQNKRLAPHLHLPLQSGCDATLKRMLRRTSQAQFRALAAAGRERIANVSITTDVIAGFPGESDEEFAVSERFVEEMEFSGLHVFRYSKRAGTAAARMRDHVPEAVKKERSARLLALSREMETRFARRFVGTTMGVLWEQVTAATPDGFVNLGYTDNYIRVRGNHLRPLANNITAAAIVDYDEGKQQLEARPLMDKLAGEIENG